MRGGEIVGMSAPIAVKRGICIDMMCSHICQVDDGVFIPTGYGSAESNKKFQEEMSSWKSGSRPAQVETVAGIIIRPRRRLLLTRERLFQLLPSVLV